MKQPNIKKIKKYTLYDIKFAKKDHKKLITLAKKHHGKAWDIYSDKPLNDADKEIVKDFIKKVKKHLYYRGQNPYCCYCGTRLLDKRSSYHLDHIIAKINRSDVVFHLRNLALSCNSCNQHKSTKSVTVRIKDIDKVFLCSENYKIVHPHFDKWHDHLEIDEYGRILAKEGSDKGLCTIDVCQLHIYSAMNVADYFDWHEEGDRVFWSKLYNSIYSGNNVRDHKKMLFLEMIAEYGSDPAAIKLIDLISKEIGVSLRG